MPVIAALHIMTELRAKFDQQGFVIVNSLVAITDLKAISKLCESEVSSKVGTRNLLQHSIVRELSRRIAEKLENHGLLPKPNVAVQCTYFHKSESKNWLVSLHRDKSIPVREKFETMGWSGWSKKEGIYFVQPPKHILQSLVAVRVHIDHTTSQNGALQVVPYSHNEVNSRERVTCEVREGGALIMRPMLLHASSKLEFGVRRVLHIVYGPLELPFPAEWAHAV